MPARCAGWTLAMDNSRDRWWARLGSNQRPYRPRKRVGRGRRSIRPDTNQHPRQILFIFLFNSLSQSCWLRSLSFLPGGGVRLGAGPNGVSFSPMAKALLLPGASRGGLKSDCVETEVRDIGTPLNQTSAHAPQATKRAPAVPRTRNCTTFMRLLGRLLCGSLVTQSPSIICDAFRSAQIEKHHCPAYLAISTRLPSGSRQ